MNTPNALLMAKARTSLAGKWTKAGVAAAIVTGICFIIQIIPVVNLVGPLLVTGPLTVGMAIYFLAIIRGESPETKTLFKGFDIFWRAVLTYFLCTLFVLLWALLLIIPGIIAAFAYSQVYFILAEHPEMKAMDVIKKSKELMKGNKWKFFCLGWRFFGWMILSVLSLGIGFFWLTPYMAASAAAFYEDIKMGGEKVEEVKVDTTPTENTQVETKPAESTETPATN